MKEISLADTVFDEDKWNKADAKIIWEPVGDLRGMYNLLLNHQLMGNNVKMEFNGHYYYSADITTYQDLFNEYYSNMNPPQRNETKMEK